MFLLVHKQRPPGWKSWVFLTHLLNQRCANIPALYTTSTDILCVVFGCICFPQKLIWRIGVSVACKIGICTVCRSKLVWFLHRWKRLGFLYNLILVQIQLWFRVLKYYFFYTFWRHVLTSKFKRNHRNTECSTDKSNTNNADISSCPFSLYPCASWVSQYQ